MISREVIFNRGPTQRSILTETKPSNRPLHRMIFRLIQGQEDIQKQPASSHSWICLQTFSHDDMWLVMILLFSAGKHGHLESESEELYCQVCLHIINLSCFRSFQYRSTNIVQTIIKTLIRNRIDNNYE